MMLRRWLSIVCIALGAVVAPSRASAQNLMPSAGSSGSAFAGTNSSGGYSASVPLDLPAARGGLAVPVEIRYMERGVGAAGRGWDVPLSYIRRDITIQRRRPLGTANVAPQGREQVFLVLGGRQLDLVRTATGWSARRDAPDLDVREQSDGTWVAYDGQGRSYRFAAVSQALVGTNLWLLQDITGVGGSKVHLEYSVATPVIAGNPAIAIDLTAVRYNPHPSLANCYKTSVNFSYDAPVSPPLAFSMLGSTALVRQHKLSFVDVSSKESCGASDVRLRRYQLDYASDADTQQPRLQSVEVFGRDGTTEAATPITVAKYTYGSALQGGGLKYKPATFDGDSPTTPGSLEVVKNDTPVLAGVGDGVSVGRAMLDITGDGRPDIIGNDYYGALAMYPNQSSVSRPNDSTLITYGKPEPFYDGTLTAGLPETRTVQAPGYASTTVGYNRTWRKAIDVNGDGRVDIIDAAEQSSHWVVYLNTPDPANPANVHWQRRSYSIATLAQQLASRGLVHESGFLPLARQAVGYDGVAASCWQWIATTTTGTKPSNSGKWVKVDGPGDCIPPEPPLEQKSVLEWEVKDINGDGYPDVVFNSSPAIVSAAVLSDDRGELGSPDEYEALVQSYTFTLQAGSANKIEAVFGILGTHLTDGNDEPFSRR